MRRSCNVVLPVGLALGSFPAVAAGEPTQPNLPLVDTDDQGAWDLDSAGNSHIDTPHLYAPARSGVSSERYYVALEHA